MANLQSLLVKWANRPYAEAEGGLHTDIFRAAIMMMEAGHPAEVIFPFLRQAANKVGERTVPDREIQSAITYAENRMKGLGNLHPKWPKFEPALRGEVVAKYSHTIASLDDSKFPQDSAFYLNKLYAPTDLVCVAMAQDSFLTLPRDTIIGADNRNEVEYVNPSPMSKPIGTTQMGRPSAHCLDNVGPKVYQVIEFDFGGAHEHVAVLTYLATKLPLLIMVYSGGKSVHGWFDVRSVADSVVLDFFTEAVHLGADPKMWSRAQFSRLPCGTNNKTGKRQVVIHNAL